MIAALELLRDAEWEVAHTIAIDAGPASVVFSRPMSTKAPAELWIRVDVVGPGTFRPLFREASLGEVVEAPSETPNAKGEGHLFDLRGDGGRQLVILLTQCGANCGLPEEWVIELTDSGPQEMVKPPPCAQCIVGRAQKGGPVLVDPIELVIAPCARVACGPSYALSVQVPKLITWDGSHFSETAATLKPSYTNRDRARPSPPPRGSGCPLDRLEYAAGLYFDARVLGMSATMARQHVDQLIPPQPLTPCSNTYSLLEPPRTWDDILDALEDNGIPVLDKLPNNDSRGR